MVGLLRWKKEDRLLPRPLRAEEISLFRLRCLCVEVPRGRGTMEAALRRRIRRGAMCLMRLGVRQVLLPPDLPAGVLPEGVRPVDTLPLRQGLAAAWATALLRQHRLGPEAAVLVTADALSASVVQTVTELSLRQRYLMLCVPYGGEELSRQLRRKYGVSLLTGPTAEQTAQAALHLAFAPVKHPGRGLIVPLYAPIVPLPPLLLPPEVEQQVPEGVEREGLVSLLWQTGYLRPSQVSISLSPFEPKAPEG